MKDELGGQTMKEFAGLRAKTYSYLKDNDYEYEKAKCTKKCVIKRTRKVRDYDNCLRESQLENIINYLGKQLCRLS